jgi:hypothetical protein
LFDGTSCTVNLSVTREPEGFGLTDMIALQFVRADVESNHTDEVEERVRLSYKYARAMVRVRQEA